MPSVSPAMLAQDLLDYFDAHGDEFEAFLLNRHQATGSVRWSTGDGTVVVTIRFDAQDGSTLSERLYGIRINRLDKPQAE